MRQVTVKLTLKKADNHEATTSSAKSWRACFVVSVPNAHQRGHFCHIAFSWVTVITRRANPAPGTDLQLCGSRVPLSEALWLHLPVAPGNACTLSLSAQQALTMCTEQQGPSQAVGAIIRPVPSRQWPFLPCPCPDTEARDTKALLTAPRLVGQSVLLWALLW